MAHSSSATVYHADVHGCSALNVRTARLFADAREGRIHLLLEGLEEGARLTCDHCFNGYRPSAADVARREVLTHTTTRTKGHHSAGPHHFVQLSLGEDVARI